MRQNPPSSRIHPPLSTIDSKTNRSVSARSELENEFTVSFREGAMGMTLSMDRDTRDAVVGKIVEQGQAFRAVRQPRGREAHGCAPNRESNEHSGAARADIVVTQVSSSSCCVLR